MQKILGVFFIFLGILGFIFPVLPGFIFFIIGISLVSPTLDVKIKKFETTISMSSQYQKIVFRILELDETNTVSSKSKFKKQISIRCKRL